MARRAKKRGAWQSHLAPAPAKPPLEHDVVSCKRDTRVVVRSLEPLGAVTLTLLDHHGDPATRPVTRNVDDGVQVFVFAPTPGSDEGLHVRVPKRDHDLVLGPSVYPRREEGAPNVTPLWTSLGQRQRGAARD